MTSRSRSFIMATAALAGGFAVRPTVASAAWSANGSGSAGAAAATMPRGSTPTLRASGSTVTVVWTGAQLSNGSAAAGYLVHRYNVATGSGATVGGTCRGVVPANSCSETVPPGTWVYTDTPVQSSWTGGESSESAPVTT